MQTNGLNNFLWKTMPVLPKGFRTLFNLTFGEINVKQGLKHIVIDLLQQLECRQAGCRVSY